MNKKKNILYITFLGILEPVAFSQVFSYLVKLSEDEDLNFTLLTLEKKTFLNREDYLSNSQIKGRLQAHKIDWHALSHHSGFGKAYDILHAFAYAMRLVIGKKIDIIHARSNEPVLIAFLLSKIFRIKIIYDRRGMMAEDYSDDATTKFKIKKGGLIYRVINGIEYRIMKSADWIVVLTDKIANHVRKDPYFKEKNRITVIPCCVEMDRFPSFEKKRAMPLHGRDMAGKTIFNYTGSLCDLHCLSEMLDFFRTAKGLVPRPHFMFLTLVDKRTIERYITGQGLGLDDFTIVSASPLTVNDYLSACDLSIMFFKPTYVRWAASPTKLAECLASGLPVIINKDIGDTEQLINEEKVGVIIDEFSTAAYQKAIGEALNLMGQKDIRQRCRNAASKHFAITRGVERYRGIYHAL